jgi:hypothetical protein
MGDGCQKGVMDAKKGCQGIWEKQPHSQGEMERKSSFGAMNEQWRHRGGNGGVKSEGKGVEVQQKQIFFKVMDVRPKMTWVIGGVNSKWWDCQAMSRKMVELS